MARVRSGHPWIFRGDLTKIAAEAAGPVDVISPNGKKLGQGLYSPKSLIALRMMTRDRATINAALIRERILQAQKMRRRFLPGQNVYRLCFGEADLLPSLIIDRYDSTMVFQTLSAGMEIFKEEIISILKEAFSPQLIVERNDVLVREKEGLPQIRQVVHGETSPQITVLIGNTQFEIDTLEGQKTGFFLDQRFNALKAASYLGGKVLDAFCHSGQFSLQAKKQIEHVDCVDISQRALANVSRNFQINQWTNFKSIEANVFDFLKEADRSRTRYDSIILDPPAFVKGKAGLAGAIRGYKEINLRAIKCLNSQGILATCSCSQNLAEPEFESILQEAARDAKRQVSVLATLSQPADHPWLIQVPETRYLKGLILQVA